MDSSYSSSPVSPPDKSPANEAPAESVDEQNSGAAQILIAKKELPAGAKEGDVFTFKARKDFGEDMSLELVKEGQEEASEPTKDNLDATTESELSALDSQGNQ